MNLPHVTSLGKIRSVLFSEEYFFEKNRVHEINTIENFNDVLPCGVFSKHFLMHIHIIVCGIMPAAIKL